MPNPFPGMNPYLEDVERWKGVHTGLIVRCAAALNIVLPDDYFADAEARVILEPVHKEYTPDVVVEQVEDFGGAVTKTAVAVMEADAPVISISEDEAEAYIEVRHISAPDEVVTAIEFLSPTNKNIGRGRDEYLEKQRQWLRLPVNFLEIDLLRAGPSTVAGLIDESKMPRHYHYVCSLHRAGGRGNFELWPSRVQERLPRLPVPLRPQDGQVTLDLNSLINAHYDANRLARRLDYAREPVPPFAGEDTVWLDSHLRALGLR